MQAISTKYLEPKESLAMYKAKQKTKARQLFYPNWVIKEIDAATNEIQVDRAMKNGRKAM